jgi:hypothetical protein
MRPVFGLAIKGQTAPGLPFSRKVATLHPAPIPILRKILFAGQAVKPGCSSILPLLFRSLFLVSGITLQSDISISLPVDSPGGFALLFARPRNAIVVDASVTKS